MYWRRRTLGKIHLGGLELRKVAKPWQRDGGDPQPDDCRQQKAGGEGQAEDVGAQSRGIELGIRRHCGARVGQALGAAGSGQRAADWVGR